jgi:hypothetical protein
VKVFGVLVGGDIVNGKRGEGTVVQELYSSHDISLVINTGNNAYSGKRGEINLPKSFCSTAPCGRLP